MSHHINIFEPFTHKPAHHEDTLTRAFLIILRAVPVAHAAWLHLVGEGHRRNEGTGPLGLLHELPTPSIHTQVGSLPHPVERVVSLLQTNEHYFAKNEVKASDRGQRFDGVISYPPKLAIVLENKLWAGTVWEGQLSINLGELTSGLDATQPPDLDPRPSCVTWASIVDAWANLLQANALGPAERVLVDDFLELVERHFDHLRPFSRVGMCEDSEFRLRRRARNLLVDLVGENAVDDHRGWGTCVLLPKPNGAAATMIGFFPNDPGTDLRIEVALGDTLKQSRALYERFDYSATVQALVKAGWETQTNLHGMHMTKGLFYPAPVSDPERYWSLWPEHLEWIRPWPRKEFTELFALLLEQGLARADERPSFDASFTDTNRQSINLCPGFIVRFRIPFNQAATLDEQGRLEDTVWQEMQRVASAFDLELPPRAQRRASPHT